MKKRRQQPFNPFICEDCSTEKDKHKECKSCYLGTEKMILEK
ncbi:hypothetical protein ES702_01813 [subsurface metagenome]